MTSAEHNPGYLFLRTANDKLVFQLPYDSSDNNISTSPSIQDDYQRSAPPSPISSIISVETLSGMFERLVSSFHNEKKNSPLRTKSSQNINLREAKDCIPHLHFY